MGIWLPSTEAQIEAGLASGDVPEGHFLDFKRELGPTPGSRKETAQDIASFAIDGGVLIVGVAEPESGKYELAPVPLDNLSERAEQIAANRPDPGLSVRTTVIPSASDPTLGYLVIEIPPSPGAPHMVDGRYWGRSERTKRQLGNDEVVRLHMRRTDQEQRLRDALVAERKREPKGLAGGRMFLVAEPLQAPSTLAREYARGEPAAVRSLIFGTEHLVPPSAQQSYLAPTGARRTERRAQGIAATTLDTGRAAPDFDGSLDVEVQFSGAVRALVSNLTYHEDHDRLPSGITHVLEDTTVAWCHRMVAWAKALGDQLGYRGPWGFGILVVGLAGARAMPDGYERRFRLSAFASNLPAYDADEFERVATATYQEMETEPKAVVDRLVGDLIHTLGVADRYSDAL